MQPYVLEIPVSLWGRDLLKDIGFILTNEADYGTAAPKLMKRMGHHPEHGLGKYLQGRKSPILPNSKKGRTGLGFSQGPLRKHYP